MESNFLKYSDEQLSTELKLSRAEKTHAFRFNLSIGKDGAQIIQGRLFPLLRCRHDKPMLQETRLVRQAISSVSQADFALEQPDQLRLFFYERKRLRHRPSSIFLMMPLIDHSISDEVVVRYAGESSVVFHWLVKWTNADSHGEMIYYGLLLMFSFPLRLGQRDSCTGHLG